MKTRNIILPVLVSFALAFTLITNWRLESEKSKIEFTANGPFGKVNGSFAGLKCNIVFDESNLQGSAIQATVDVNTIETGVGLRNKDLREKEEWFNAAKYPLIAVQSKQFKKTATGYEMSADLTMKGVTKPVVIPFTFTPAGNGALFLSQFTVNREDFGVGKPGGSVAKEVKLKLEIQVSK